MQVGRFHYITMSKLTVAARQDYISAALLDNRWSFICFSAEPFGIGWLYALLE